MSQGFHQGIYSYSNAYERPPPAPWMVRENASFEGLPFDGGGMLTEIINLPWRKPDVLEDQIHHGYTLPQKQQQQQQLNGGGAEELSFMNPEVKAGTNLEGFEVMNNSEASRVLEGQGLSLSLSCLSKNGGLYLHGNSYGLEDIGTNQMVFGSPRVHENQIRFGYVESSTSTNSLKNSRYMKAAQELLMEFCCVGKGGGGGQFMKKQDRINPNSASADNNGGGSSSSSKERHHPLSPSERTQFQRRKIRLLSMLDEVEGRYTRYCEQMQAVVKSFDAIMGKGAAGPYTGLARRAMSQHFRSMKDAVAREVRACCEALGEKEVKGGITKGETPRLKAVEQKYRQHKALQHMGMMDPDSWRPQRGLPERSVTTLRAWLFDHFLHPYPSEADKHLLSRQTGLSKNQVSNWFINARVRLWKPMVEDMYQQEAKDEEGSSHDANSEEKDDLTMPTEYRCFMENPEMGSGLVGRGGAGNSGTQTAGEVSLTLGLRRSEIITHLPIRDHFEAY